MQGQVVRSRGFRLIMWGGGRKATERQTWRPPTLSVCTWSPVSFRYSVLGLLGSSKRSWKTNGGGAVAKPRVLQASASPHSQRPCHSSVPRFNTTDTSRAQAVTGNRENTQKSTGNQRVRGRQGDNTDLATLRTKARARAIRGELLKQIKPGFIHSCSAAPLAASKGSSITLPRGAQHREQVGIGVRSLKRNRRDAHEHATHDCLCAGSL